MRWLHGSGRTGSTARELYGVVVAQARVERFYAELGVPDTPEGRFEMIVLHVALLVERLAAAGEAGSRLSQLLAEQFVADMDDNMREMGVGDLTVPRKVKRAAAGLYERTARYRAALAPQAGAEALPALVRELLLAPEGQPKHADTHADTLADYVRRSAAGLARQPTAELLAGRAAFAHPGRAGT